MLWERKIDGCEDAELPERAMERERQREREGLKIRHVLMHFSFVTQLSQYKARLNSVPSMFWITEDNPTVPHL